MGIFNEVNDTKLTLGTLELGASTQVDIVLPSLKRFQDLADATDELKKSVAQNVDGIARVEQQKQDRLPQVDLDNIASIDRMKDDIKGKQDKLTNEQIANIDKIQGLTNAIGDCTVKILKLKNGDTFNLEYINGTSAGKATINGLMFVTSTYTQGNASLTFYPSKVVNITTTPTILFTRAGYTYIDNVATGRGYDITVTADASHEVEVMIIGYIS